MGPSLHPYRPAGLKSDTAPLQRLAPGPCHALPVHQAPRHIGTMTVKTTGRRARKRQGSTDMTTPSTPAGTPALANLDSLYSQIAAPLPPVQFTGATGARYNMGAGQPDPASLPKMELIETLEGIFSGPEGDLALMYGDAAGFIGLREVLAAKLKRWEGIETNPRELLIVNGSNHGLATVAQAFLNVGDTAI
ncbi:MAG: hypothetical protein EBT00_17020, partial [Proteobacteria bacterium]|nr:hypothetical protein [Pseudomonadota bacterium]